MNLRLSLYYTTHFSGEYKLISLINADILFMGMSLLLY